MDDVGAILLIQEPNIKQDSDVLFRIALKVGCECHVDGIHTIQSAIRLCFGCKHQ